MLLVSEDSTVRGAIVSALGSLKDVSALQVLTRAVVKDPSGEVRSGAADAIRALPMDWREKAGFALRFLIDSGITRTRLDALNLLKAIGPNGSTLEGTTAVADLVMAKAFENGSPQGNRTLALFAELIVQSVERDLELAGERLNVFQREHQITEEALQALRVQIGGEAALSPILKTLEINLKENFQEPINRLNEETQGQWRKTIKYSQIGFATRMAMSAIVFAAGMALIVFSGVALIAGDLETERLLGPGISFLSALGTVLLLIYSGPLKEIRRSMVDLGAASAAFIGYVHRVLQVSHTFSAYYLQRQMTFSENKKSCELIDDAMRDTIEMLEGARSLSDGDDLKVAS